MKKAVLTLLTVAMLGMTATACGTNGNGNVTKQQHHARNGQVNILSKQNAYKGQQHSDLMKKSQMISDKITEIKEVKSSYVMISGKNAYVAVSLDENEPKGNNKLRVQSDRQAQMNKNRNHNRTGMKSKSSQPFVNETATGTNGQFDLMNNSNRALNHSNPDLTHNNAMNNGKTGNQMHMKNTVNEELRAQIEKITKQIDPTVQQVHISTHPDFVTQMNGHINDLNLGRPVNDIMTELEASVNKFFGTVTGTSTGTYHNGYSNNHMGSKGMTR